MRAFARSRYREEYVELLEKFNVEYNPRYIFKTDDD